jgi:hypothetical protein
MVLLRRLAAAALMIFIVGGVAQGQTGRTPADAPATLSQPAAPAAPIVEARNADETREQLYELLHRYPPALGRVLKLDPSLLTNQSYLAPYPALASFLAAHPDVARTPAYFLERVDTPDGSWRPADARTQILGFWKDVYSDIGAFLIFLTITFSLIWLIRTLLDWRRWTRMARSQADVHAKLLERFSTNEDLLAYIQTPVGRRFLESGPVLAESGPRPLGAPVSRILWSFQAGVVLAMAGLGLLFASRLVAWEVGQGFNVLAVLAMALGVGFILAGVAAWLISRRMGLFEAVLPHAPAKDVNVV